MEFIVTPELAAYMEKQGKRNIVVEVASSDHSDFEVTELFLRLVNDRQAKELKEKKRYVGRPTNVGEAILPPYRLHYDEVVTFGLKKYWIFHKMTYEGVRL